MDFMYCKTMKLDGGILTYLPELKRYYTNKPPYGRKVRFLNKNGTDWDLREAQAFLKEGQVLTVKEIYVDRMMSMVEFVEIPGKRFNSVMFTDVEE